ncbi:ABC transporter ATP-binding protein [Streptomyces sp. NPDC055078]
MKLRGVGRRYGLGGPWVLRGVDLDLSARSLIRVMGTNGTGKSTLLRLIAGIDAPTEGRIDDRPRTAYVPERFPAVLPFTAIGYLTHLGRIHGLGRRTARERAAEWLERFGAAGHARTPLAELSKGTSQKVAVAQALLAGPELLVLDEAWTGLDADARAWLDRAVAERVDTGAIVVFVDHDPLRLQGRADAEYELTDRALIRRPEWPGHGPPVRVVASGPPGAIPPDSLPGTPSYEKAPDGTAVFTVPEPHSDALLRALLGAGWHIRGVESRESEAEVKGADEAKAEGADEAKVRVKAKAKVKEEDEGVVKPG